MAAATGWFKRFLQKNLSRGLSLARPRQHARVFLELDSLALRAECGHRDRLSPGIPVARRNSASTALRVSATEWQTTVRHSVPSAGIGTDSLQASRSQGEILPPLRFSFAPRSCGRPETTPCSDAAPPNGTLENLPGGGESVRLRPGLARSLYLAISKMRDGGLREDFQ